MARVPPRVLQGLIVAPYACIWLGFIVYFVAGAVGAPDALIALPLAVMGLACTL